VLNKSKYKISLRFFKVATLCLCLLLALSTSFTWNAFSTVLKELPHYAEHLLAAFPSLCGPTHPKPSRLGLGWVICGGQVISITLLLGQIALTQPGVVLGQCWVIVLLKNK
jgi:hypothetical protein